MTVVGSPARSSVRRQVEEKFVTKALDADDKVIKGEFDVDAEVFDEATDYIVAADINESRGHWFHGSSIGGVERFAYVELSGRPCSMRVFEVQGGD